MEQIAEGFKNEKAIVTPYSVRNYMAGNPVTSQLFVTHIGYYPDARYHYRERPEGANENILIYCEKGKGWIEHNETRNFLSANQIYIIPAHEAHSYGADKHNPWSIYWLHFRGENVNMFDSIISVPITLYEADNSRLNDRIGIFEEMYQNYNMGYNPENLEYVTYCFMYFLASIKYLPQYREIKKVKVDDVIQKCILFMKNNLENKVTLKDIADAVGYSASHLNLLFSQRTSFSPMEYYNQLRIQRACTYLQFSDLKIKEIAFKLDFYDPFHFSKAFFKEMNISPKEYRKRYRDRKDTE